MILFRINEVSSTHQVILDPGVVKVLHVVVVAAEIGGHPCSFQLRFQFLHQHLGGTVFTHRPNCKGKNKKNQGQIRSQISKNLLHNKITPGNNKLIRNEKSRKQ